MTGVLVTDGDERAALAVVRSLGRAGYLVHVGGTRHRTLASVSRQATSAFATPDPLCTPDDFASAVASYVAAHDIDVVVPITEAALLATLDARSRFGGAIIPFPSAAVFRTASDKALLGAIAGKLKIAVPRQWQIANAAALEDLDLSAFPYPVVIKPGRSVGEHDGVRSKHVVRYAADVAELRVRVAQLGAAAFPALVQQRLVGPGMGVFLLRWNDKTVASFAHRRIREKPPAGGVSVYAEAVSLDAALVAQSERLLTALNWQGVAMVEYKMDQATGTAYLMEINGRFWGSLQLAIDAGVDFPTLLVGCALGRVVPPNRSYRVGTRGRWWWGEVDHVIARLSHSDAELSLPPGSPGRGAALADFLGRGGDAVFRFDDPMPFLYESARWLRRQ